MTNLQKAVKIIPMIDIYLDEDMEMPCLCSCGEWFDLNDGYSQQNSNQLVCSSCHQMELDRTVTIADLKCGNKFEYDGGDYEVVRKFHPKHGYLVANYLLGQKKFYDDGEEVLKLN